MNVAAKRRSNVKIANLDGEVLFEIPSSRTKIVDGITRLEDIDLSSANLNGGIFRNLLFTLGDFDSAQFERSIFQKVEFDGSVMSDVNMTAATIDEVAFYAVYAYGAKFAGAQLRKVSFCGSNLVGADFSSAMFEGVLFGKDNTGHKTNLSGANLSDVNLCDVVFDGVEYDDSTKFPANFDPASHRGFKKILHSCATAR